MCILIFLLTVIILLLLLLYIMKKGSENMFQKYYYFNMMSEFEHRSRNHFDIDSSFDASMNSACFSRVVKRKYPVTPIPTKHEQEHQKIKYKEYYLEDYLKKNK